jgi:hypothetical protein
MIKIIPNDACSKSIKPELREILEIILEIEPMDYQILSYILLVSMLMEQQIQIDKACFYSIKLARSVAPDHKQILFQT